MKKKIPIGMSDFKKIIDGGYAYVDKSLFIQELVDKGAHIALIPRPRRFGKTLNLSMLRHFFEKQEEETSYLFADLEIWKHERYRSLQGQFPVIWLSFKDAKFSSWEETFKVLRFLIAQEFERHHHLVEQKTLTPKEQNQYSKIVSEEADAALLAQSLLLLSKWLHRHHKVPVILLIDEYDTPVHVAYVEKYYAALMEFMRNWLSAGLKDNVHLELGVLTGILRVAKESLFSGLNNVATFTILNESFRDKFGFLESEVKALLKQFDLSERLPQLKQWYNGYRIGSCSGIYNPWSVLQCIVEGGALAPYWVNTSDNALAKHLIAQGNSRLKTDLEDLLRGRTIAETVEESISFPSLEQNSDAVWSLLLYTGYLTIGATPSYGTPTPLKIPNTEVGEVYRTMVVEWFTRSIDKDNYRLLLTSLTSGDIETFSQIFQKFMASSVSVFDIPAEDSEKIYHAFILGMLIGLKSHEVKSNRESGFGRYDVMLIPKNPRDLGIIMEFKKISSPENSDLEKAAVAAFKQIEEKNYAQELHDQGVDRILHLAFAFAGKKCLIRQKTSPL